MTSARIAIPEPSLAREEVPDAYMQALDRAGGRGTLLMPGSRLDPAEADRILEPFGGLLLAGGGDVEPGRYGAGIQPQTTRLDPSRDRFELELVGAAMRRSLPVLGVCRGMQVLNVALGGTLVQHIDAGVVAHDGLPDETIDHIVKIEPGSLVAAAMGVARATAPSRHHQCVGRLGAGLRPVAWAEDGVVEAIEHGRGWIVGVQWHPELAAGRDPAHQALFDHLVLRAAAPADLGVNA